MSGAVLDHVIVDPKSRSLVYRRRFPQHLIPLIPRADGKGMGRKEIRASLKAKNIDDPDAARLWQESKDLYQSLVDQAQRLYSQQERSASENFDVLTPDQVKSISELFYVRVLMDDEASRRSDWSKSRFEWTTRMLREQGEEFPTGSADAEWMHSAIFAHQVIRKACRSLRAKAKYDDIHEAWGKDAVNLSLDAGFVIDPSGASAKALAEALNNMAILSSEAVLKRLDGDDVPTPADPIVLVKAAPTSKPVAVDLMDVFERYSRHQGMTSNVRSEWRKYVAHLCGFLGHSDARLLTEDDVRSWRDHLLATPGQRGLRSPVTVKSKYLAALKSTLNWAAEEKVLPRNVARDVKVRVGPREKVRESYYSADEASEILAATLRPVSKRLSAPYLRAIRWVPWLCAYTGARVGELAQLRKSDIRQEDGVWVLNLTPEAGQIKTHAARLVPIHEHLLEQGFVEAVQNLPDGHIFYDPDKKRGPDGAEDNRHAKKVATKIREWLKGEVGLSPEGIQPNHAWRHLFKTIAEEVGISERTCDAIQGHAPANVSRGYGGSTLKSKAEAMKRFPRFQVSA